MTLALRHFQIVGRDFLAGHPRAILADPPGLGKTCQALAALDRPRPTLVIAPSVAFGVWRDEAPRWREGYVVSAQKTKRDWRWPLGNEIRITSWDMLPAKVEAPEAGAYAPNVILDECHYAKNAKALRTQRAAAIVKHARWACGLSGTPMTRDPLDLWTVMRVLGLERIAFPGGWAEFVHAFKGWRHPRFGMKWGKPEPWAAERLRRVMLRRRREDVLPDLPPLTYQEIEAEIDALARVRADETLSGLGTDLEAAIEKAVESQGGLAFESLAETQAALAMAKLPTLFEWLDRDEDADEPVLVYSPWLNAARGVAARPGWALIAGETPRDERTRIVERFQAGELRGVAYTKAGGVGVTLTRAAILYEVALPWSPADVEQAEGRAWRIGQNRPVLVRRLVANHALDKAVAKVLAKKARYNLAVDGAAG